MSFEEYLEFEKSSETRHEFVDGFVFAMAGANNAHNTIAGNVFVLSQIAANKAECRAYISDMKLRTPESEGKGYYPDVFVTCDKNDFDTDVKTTACFIVEVLSKSTEDIDRGEKWQNYRKFTSLKAYILISQKQKYVEVYRLMPDGSWRYDALENQGLIDLPCINTSISLEEIYQNVIFKEE